MAGRRAVDVSNYSGEISAGQADRLVASEIARIAVGLQDLAIARPSLEAAAAAGLEIEVYCELTLGGDVGGRVSAQLAGVAGLPVRRAWLGAEDTWSGLGPADTVAALQAARAAAEASGLPVGGYTAPWWWDEHTGGWTGWSDLPLWYAHYDDDPNLDTFRPFGGWTHALMKQYAQNRHVADVWCDLNVFVDEGPQPGDPFTFSFDRTRSWANNPQAAWLIDALLAGRVQGHQYVDYRGRAAPAIVVVPE